MKIEHVALWTKNLEQMKVFYENFFDGKSNSKYINEKKQFESYILTFESGARLEIMRIPSLQTSDASEKILEGYAHISFSVGSKEEVDGLTEALKQNGYTIIDGPRKTGDGYYESCVLDPDGNRVEITI